jgi:hypothetical protein
MAKFGEIILATAFGLFIVYLVGVALWVWPWDLRY